MISRIISSGSDTSAPQAELPDRAEFRRVRRFIVVGCLSVAIDLLAYTLFRGVMTAAPAKGLSYVLGMLFGFVCNKVWTFESDRRSASEPILYAVVYSVTLAVNILVNSACLTLLGENGRVVAFLVATGLTTVLNYLGLRWLAFRTAVRTAASRAVRREP